MRKEVKEEYKAIKEKYPNMPADMVLTYARKSLGIADHFHDFVELDEDPNEETRW